ncbi:oxidoreductase [Streptomyces sp. WM6372]|uniref:NADPH:quinone reductase n=1 Tax=Streptomyces sp. WM6372 TaxID=1415555 RepID=UPI0006ADE7B8|nr:NADPH:quinone reductase [Streptomyces sp. WM6372]KOU21404.1 oxidoreductase [Streptomyces sp. WM6372]
MHAAYIEQLGPAELIRFGELPAPQPGPSDVLVEVDVVSVNHVDTFVRSGAWRTPLAFPFVIGRDLVGTVLAAGPEVAHRFAPGDRVWCNSLGHDGRQGAAAEQAVVPADRLYPLPEGVDPVDAVALAHPAVTAYLALFDQGQISAGDTVLVLGAAGNVGSALVTMAAQAGARVIATSSPRDFDYVRELGAAEVIDYNDPDVPGRIRELSPDGVDIHVDTSARNDLDTAVDLLASRGRIVLLSGMRTRPVLPVGPLYLKDCSVRGFAISHATAGRLAAAAAHVNKLTAAGLLRPRGTEVLPLSEAAQAHRLLDEGKVTGKLVLRARS